MSVSLDTSLRFNPAKTSTHDAATALAADLIQSIQHDRGQRFTRQPDLYHQNLTTILLNLYTASMTPGEPWVAYSRDANDQMYKAKSRYNSTRLSYQRVMVLLEGLSSRGLTEAAPGFYDPITGVSKLSRMRASEELEEFFDVYGLTPRMTNHIRETVRMKDRKKKLVEYTDNKTTKRMRSALDRINASLMKTDVRLNCSLDELHMLVGEVFKRNRGDGLKDFDRTSTTLYRVFNNVVPSKMRLTQGGRFYGHWVQCLPSSYRGKLLLDGQPVCELDFAGLSINMLYLREGLPLPVDDVYTVEGMDVDRDVMKGILQRLLNAESMTKAKQAIRDQLQDEAPDLLPMVNEIVKAFMEKHQQLTHHFATGVGLELQRDDSRMASSIMLQLLDKGITCIPVHDSFIVQGHHRDELREVMEKVSKEVLGTVLRIS